MGREKLLRVSFFIQSRDCIHVLFKTNHNNYQINQQLEPEFFWLKMLRPGIFVVTMSIMCYFIVNGTTVPDVAFKETLDHKNQLSQNIVMEDSERIDLGPNCDPICEPDEHLIRMTK